ncbi:MAG: SDR family oxidoreductase [Clostridia bacterium]|nr:SDR family oxidoreductase [Clostridia bacterium]
MKVLITGTSSGIGLAAAKLFLGIGHEVYGIDIADSEINNDLYHHYKADILSKDLPDIDGVEILVNCAGVQTQSEADIDVNLKGTINVTEKYAFNHKIRSVLIVASASGTTGSEFKEYAASKGGLIAYSKNVAKRLAPLNAVCNSLSPGGVVTSLNKHILYNDKLYEAVKNETLLHKWASAEEIAEWIYFLTVVNKSATGIDVIVDNGEAINYNFIW